MTRQEALAKLRDAVKTRGVSLMATEAALPQTHLSTIINGGRPLGRESASRLRPLLPELPADVWVELLAPVDEIEAAP